MPTTNRSYRAVERMWLNEYLASRYPGVRIQNEYRLHYENPSAVGRGPGGSPTGQEGATIARLDALLELTSEVAIWEASQWLHFGQLAKAEHYKALLPETWEGRTLIHKPVTWHLLASHGRRAIQQAAAASGFEYVVFLPSWLEAHQTEVEAAGQARRLSFQERPAGSSSSLPD
jgi:hypothetical protein